MSSATEAAGISEEERANSDNKESIAGAESDQQGSKKASHLRIHESDSHDQQKGKNNHSVQIGSDTNLVVLNFCNANDWAAVLQLIKDHPKEAASSHQDTDNKTTTVLHKTLASKTIDAINRIAIVTEVLRVAPETAAIKNCHGSLPLHVATRNRVTMEPHVREQVVSELVEAHPAALTTGDAALNTPLHVACDKWCSSKEAKLLIDAAPKAASITNERGMLPIHIACARRCSPDKLRLLLEAYPDGIDAAMSDGATPIDIATSSATDEHPNFAMLEVLNDVMQERLEFAAARRLAGNKRSASSLSQHSQRPASEGGTDSSGVTSNFGSTKDGGSGGGGDSADKVGSGDDTPTRQMQSIEWQQESATSSAGADQSEPSQQARLEHLAFGNAPQQFPLGSAAEPSQHSASDSIHAGDPLDSREEQVEAHHQHLLERGRLSGVIPPPPPRDDGDAMLMLGQRARLIVAQTRMQLAGAAAGSVATQSPMLQRLREEHDVIIREMYRLHEEQGAALEQLLEATRHLEREMEALILAREDNQQL